MVVKAKDGKWESLLQTRTQFPHSSTKRRKLLGQLGYKNKGHETNICASDSPEKAISFPKNKSNWNKQPITFYKSAKFVAVATRASS